MQKALKGFTLVELLVAVGIIGVLASVSIVSVSSVRSKARDAKRVSEIKEMQNGLEAFYSNNGSYPTVVGATSSSPKELGTADYVALCSNDAGFVKTADCTPPTFMQTINQDPLKGSPAVQKYQYAQLMEDGNDCAAKPCPSYSLKFNLEGGTGSFAKGAHEASPNGIK